MEINYNFETNFALPDEDYYSDWIDRVVGSEGFVVTTLAFVFCDDAYLLDINQKYLNHDTYTDIITFDYSDGKTISGDIFISIERVSENAKTYGVDRNTELHRVMAHGLLHLMGYGDKTEEEAVVMRAKEDEKLKLFHVEH